MREIAEIARVYRTRKKAVFALLSDFGAAPSTDAANVDNVLQLLDNEVFAARFWSLDGKPKFIGQLIQAVGSVASGLIGKEAQKDAIRNDRENRAFQSEMQAKQAQQAKDEAYNQMLMQDKQLAWNYSHDSTTTTQLVLEQISAQEKAEKQQKMLVIGGAMVLAGLIIYMNKEKIQKI